MAQADDKPRLIVGVAGKPIDDAERDPGTIAEEQRRRSDEYLASLGQSEPQETAAHLPSPSKR